MTATTIHYGESGMGCPDGRDRSVYTAAKVAAKCPPWCDHDHVDEPDCPHYSAVAAPIGMTWARGGGYGGQSDFMQVGLDQPTFNAGPVVVTVSTDRGDFRLQLHEARQLALVLLQLDDAARGAQ